ncbi:MAG: L-glutamate gamma-semialdehyde dehydrogenase [Trueperaceae bacterium]|nr:L-glutamate gamma-semialdehyde dehydrogenase [Trueperaceae bacterium]
MAFEPYRNEPFTDFADPAAAAAYRDALEEVRGRLGRRWPLVIGGERVETGRWLQSFDPCDPTVVVGEVAMAGPDEIERAMTAATAAYTTWSRWPMLSRARALVRLAAIMRRRKLEFCAWETFEAAKNWREADADVAEAIDFLEYYARESLALAAPLRTHAWPGEENITTLQPLGVGVVIPPWNFLLAILVGTVAAPLVVGNTIVVKPSPATPVIAGLFMECVEEAGLPAGVINLLTGADEDLGDALVDDPRTRFINFTGSIPTGTRIHERAAKIQPGQRFVKRTMLEMGGKDALIVDETADLELAAESVVGSAFSFNGQKCSALSRLIVVDDVHDDLMERVLTRARTLTIGRATENADVTAVITERQFDRIGAYLEAAPSQGRVVLGGSPAKGAGAGWFIEPTIVDDVPADAPIACEEVFGPVLAVIRARDFEHAVEIFNSVDYGLTGGLISRSRDRIERARTELQAGNLYVNRKITGALVGVQPFGGFKLSGTNSKAGGPDYLRLFMEAKTVTERF